MKTRRLSLSEDYDFKAVGLASADKPYKLAWHINQALKINLEKVEDHAVVKANADILFNCMRCNDENNALQYILLENKTLGKLLIPELVAADYIFIFRGELWQLDMVEIKKKVKSISTIQLVFDIDVHGLRSKQNLLVND